MAVRISQRRLCPTSIDQQCVICGAPALGMNFGVVTCAPCKAFFRRNARRKELLDLPCRHRHLFVFMTVYVHIRELMAQYLQIRRCSSCRLRRCFTMGMKEELVRTEKENQRYRELVQVNRKRRAILKQQVEEIRQLAIPQAIFNNDLTNSFEWSHLSNILYAYDTCAIKTFVQERSTSIFTDTIAPLDSINIKKYPTTITSSIVLSAATFFRSLPAFYALSPSCRNYLCKTNIRPLIFPNLHELNQSCYSEPWQLQAFKATWQMMSGPQLYPEFQHVEKISAEHILTDPVVTRLWIVTLFFSSPLHYHYDAPTVTPLLKKKKAIFEVQHAYATLLWKYLLHRYNEMEAIRSYSNLMRVYLKMQQVGHGIYVHLKTQQELLTAHETLHRLVTLNINDSHK